MLLKLHLTNQFYICFFTLVYPEPEGLPESSSGSETRQKDCQNWKFTAGALHTKNCLNFLIRHQLLLLKQKVGSPTMSATFHFNYIPIFMEVEVLL